LLARPLTDSWAELLIPDLLEALVLFTDPVLVLEPVLSPAALLPGRARLPFEADPASARRFTPILELALELPVLELWFPG
jgi:hypothetical protein